MPVPKRKTSKSQLNKRRTHQKITGPNVIACPECGEAKLPHHVCPGCGVYKGRTVLEIDE